MFKISLPQKTWQCEKRSVSVAYGDFLEINLCVYGKLLLISATRNVTGLSYWLKIVVVILHIINVFNYGYEKQNLSRG